MFFDFHRRAEGAFFRLFQRRYESMFLWEQQLFSKFRDNESMRNQLSVDPNQACIERDVVKVIPFSWRRHGRGRISRFFFLQRDFDSNITTTQHKGLYHNLLEKIYTTMRLYIALTIVIGACLDESGRSPSSADIWAWIAQKGLQAHFTPIPADLESNRWKHLTVCMYMRVHVMYSDRKYNHFHIYVIYVYTSLYLLKNFAI
jgi:hypothetical protein